MLGTVRKTFLGQPIVDLDDTQSLKIKHTRTGWIVFIPRNKETRETCETLVEAGYIRPMGRGYVSAKQEIFFHLQITEKTRKSRASR